MRQNVYSSSYKPYIKKKQCSRTVCNYINQKEKTNKSNKRVKRERGRREMFFFVCLFFFFLFCFFVFFLAAVNTRARGSNHTVSIL